MISTKNKLMTPTERKAKVSKLKEEHQDYFQKIGNVNALYIPKMAYRPSGKDDLHVSFFPSELEKKQDIYTEFVSIDYDSEDPKRTLYKHLYNPHWKEEYELITSNSGFERHLIPVSELTVIKDLNTKSSKQEPKKEFFLPDPDDTNDITKVLQRIATALESIAKSINK